MSSSSRSRSRRPTPARSGRGFKPSSASQEGIVFIQMGCMALALFNHDAIAEDATVPPGDGGFRGVILAYNTRAKEENEHHQPYNRLTV